jgi:lipopolysaccharide export system permease protein
MRSGRVQPGGTVLNEVTVFLFDDGPVDRIIADEARLQSGHWLIAEGMGYRADAPPQRLTDLLLPTTSTPADLKVRLASTDDLTFFELGAALGTQLNDPILRNAVATRFMRLLTLPLLLAGSVLIAFAFTAGYRRSNKYGAAVLYGIVLGFVVFFVTEMADRAGSAGALDPTFAAVGPAFVAIVVGLTVLLYREDGRA